MNDKDDQMTNIALMIAQLSERLKAQETAQRSTENMDEWYLAFEMWFSNQFTAPNAEHTTYLIVWDATEQLWLQYQERGFYLPILEEDIYSIIKNWADDAGIKTSQSRFSHGVERLKSKCRFREEWDDPSYINFQNGIYNIKEKQFVPHDPQYRSRFQLGVSYQPIPDPTPCWDKIRLCYPEQIARFESFVLASLYQDFSNEGLYFGVGKTGSGKGTIAQILQIMYGNGIANVQFENLDNDKFGLVPLLGKRICLNREMTITTLNCKVISFLKDVVTHEGPIDVNMKNKNRFPYLFNIWFFGFTNQLPYLSDSTDRTAWFRRTIIDVYDKTQTKDVQFKENVKKEANAIISKMVQSDYKPIITSGTNIDEVVAKNAELWDYWSDPIKRIIQAIFEKSTDVNARIDVHAVWDIVDHQLKEANHNIKYERVQSYTTMYLDRLGIRKINRKVYGPIAIKDLAIKKQYEEDQLEDEAKTESKPKDIDHFFKKY